MNHVSYDLLSAWLKLSGLCGQIWHMHSNLANLVLVSAGTSLTRRQTSSFVGSLGRSNLRYTSQECTNMQSLVKCLDP